MLKPDAEAAPHRRRHCISDRVLWGLMPGMFASGFFIFISVHALAILEKPSRPTMTRFFAASDSHSDARTLLFVGLCFGVVALDRFIWAAAMARDGTFFSAATALIRRSLRK